MFFPALISFDAIDRDALNRSLVGWQHKMGPWKRAENLPEWFHGMRHNGELVAVTAAAALIKEPVAGLRRHEAIELGSLCAARPALNRVSLRLWREFVFRALAEVHGFAWAVSYQDASEHTGDLYRFDGWVRLGRSRSGTDARSGAIGRDKIIWGWCADDMARKARAA